MTVEQILLVLASLNAAGVGTVIVGGLRWVHRVELRLRVIERELKITSPGML